MKQPIPLVLLLALILTSTPALTAEAALDPFTAPASRDKPLYLNPDAPLAQRVKDLIGRMTLEEKADALDHKGPDLTRIGLPSDKWNQCLHGVSWTEPTTLFPIPTGLAATWDPKLLHQVASAISDEARAIYNGWHDNPNFVGERKGLIYRSPVINILRNPYWGRDSEAYSEDPFLCGRMAVAFVTGLQGDDPRYLKLAATVKHFAVNNVESNRQNLSATVSERMLHEYWLPHWKDAIVEGHARSVMASYNQINGVHNVFNKELLTDILKKDWGFDGFVVSDLGGVHNSDMVVQSINAGCDFSDKEFSTLIPAAVTDGQISQARLDEALSRVLKVRFQLGEFDPADRVPYRKIPMSVICSPENRALSLQASRESIVLLQNRDHLLPLDQSTLKSVALIGPLADRFIAGNPGYIGKAKRHTISIRQGLADQLGNSIPLACVTGAEIHPPTPPKNATPPPPIDTKVEIQKAVEAAKQADVAIVCVGTDGAIEEEGHDRKSLGLPGNQEELVKAVLAANPKTIVLLANAGPLTIPWIKEHAPAILEVWWSGEEQGHAVAETLVGKNNPAGRLPYTVYASEAQVPPQDEYDISKGFTYMYLKGEALWPFGFGISYTSFAYSDLKLASETISPDGKLDLQVTVQNTGSRAGDEVVQLYTKAKASSVMRPAKELRGFQRITLQPGEKKSLSFSVPASKLAYWDVKTHAFVVEPGSYEVQLGASSEDIREKAGFSVK